MDPSHVCLIDIDYNIPHPNHDAYKFAIRLEDLMRSLKLIKDPTLDIHVQRDHVQFTSNTAKFQIRKIETSDTMTPLPTVPFTENITTTYKELHTAIKFIASQSSFITFSPNKVSCKTDNGLIETTFPAMYDVRTDNGTFDLDYLGSFMKALKVKPTQKIQIQYSKEKPLKMTIDTQNVHIDLYLAPRVEN